MAASMRAEKSGFARDVQQKLAASFDGNEAAKTLRWLKALPAPATLPQHLVEAARKIPGDIQFVAPEDYATYLNDGLALGYLMGCLDSSTLPSNLPKAWQISPNSAFETSRQRDRIGIFLNFCSTQGVADAFKFQTEQLYENTNLNQVVVCLSQLGIEAQAKPGYVGPPGMWIRKHHENKRIFSEEQMRSGENIIGLQMGSNSGANASGVSFGAIRHINDMH